MGIRQPSRTATFFKQAQAGAEAQKEARETLKKPQALGGAAAVGTAMVANTTGAQKQATQEVKTAGADTTAKVGTAIAGIAPSATSTVYSGTNAPSTPVAALPGDTATVADVDAAQTNINNDIKTTTDAINALNDKIKTANAADAKLLQDQKAALEKILQDAQDKLTKENLGQIAGPSTFETEMAQREKLLAEEGGNVGKLATIFGPRWNAKKYGGLSSQIYGKDLEAIQEEASAGLEEKARAEGRADVAEKEYKEGIASGKLKVAEKLKSEQAKLDFLKKTPEELSAYSRDELKKIFGFEDKTDANKVTTNQIDKLFNFDDKGKSTGSKLTATQLALTDRNKALADNLTKIPELRNKAVAKQEENWKTIDTEITGAQGRGALIGSTLKNTSYSASVVNDLAKFIQETKDDRFAQNWNGISKDEALVKGMQNAQAEFSKVSTDILKKIDDARKNKDSNAVIAHYKELKNAESQLTNEIQSRRNQLSHTLNKYRGGVIDPALSRLNITDKYR